MPYFFCDGVDITLQTSVLPEFRYVSDFHKVQKDAEVAEGEAIGGICCRHAGSTARQPHLKPYRWAY